MKFAKRVIAYLVFVMILCAMALRAKDGTQGRSMVVARKGIVAAESPLAAQAGATILAHGGNAIDAAVAANAVMGVVEPMMNGIGGDLFALVYDAKSGKVYVGSGSSGRTSCSSRFTKENAKSLRDEVVARRISHLLVSLSDFASKAIRLNANHSNL